MYLNALSLVAILDLGIINIPFQRHPTVPAKLTMSKFFKIISNKFWIICLHLERVHSFWILFETSPIWLLIGDQSFMHLW